MDSSSNDAARLSLVIEQLVRAFRPLTAGDPLSQAAAAVLSRLDTSGPRGVTGLARAERVTQPAMTQLVTRLHDEGLVSREASPTDRRSVVVSLTERGRDALADRRARRAEHVAEALAGVETADQRAIFAALPGLENFVRAAQQLENASE